MDNYMEVDIFVATRLHSTVFSLPTEGWEIKHKLSIVHTLFCLVPIFTLNSTGLPIYQTFIFFCEIPSCLI
jgi:hypothetical protein